MVQLPKYVAIKSLSNKKYLRPVSGSKRLLKFDGADVNSRGVKHEVVYSKSQPGKVHIRCVETGTYWGWPEYGAAGIIAAQIKKPDSRLSGDTCTLFKYTQRTRGGVIVFHLEISTYARWVSIETDSKGFLKTESKGRKNPTNFIIEDWKKASRPKPEGGTGTSTGNTGTSRGGASNDHNDLNNNEDEDLNDDDDGDLDNDDDDDGENKKNTGGGTSTVNNFSGGGPTIGSTNTSGGFSFANLNINGGTVTYIWEVKAAIEEPNVLKCNRIFLPEFIFHLL